MYITYYIIIDMYHMLYTKSLMLYCRADKCTKENERLVYIVDMGDPILPVALSIVWINP